MRFFPKLSVPSPCPHPSCFAHAASMQKKKKTLVQEGPFVLREKGGTRKNKTTQVTKRQRGNVGVVWAILSWRALSSSLEGGSSLSQTRDPQAAAQPQPKTCVLTTAASSLPRPVSGSDSTGGVFRSDRFPTASAPGGSNNA